MTFIFLFQTVKALKFIFITHLHADHHLGINRIIEYRKKLLESSNENLEDIHIIGPPIIQKWLSIYSTVYPLYYKFTLITETAQIKFVLIQFLILIKLSNFKF